MVDSRLNRLGGKRLVHLRRSDCPRVAQAILDNLGGKAQVRTGAYRGVQFVEFYCNSYVVVIRGDDWKKIYPFIKYGSGAYRPVTPPDSKPPRVMSPQPNRDMEPPPENPGVGIRSWLEHFDFATYKQIQQLLSASQLDPSLGYPSADLPQNQRQSYLNPPVSNPDGVDTEMYNRLVNILQQLFPDDFPIR